MSTTQPPAQSPAPTITNAGTRPSTPHKLFLSLPVADVQRTITFFEALGFTFNQQFTDASATCMLVGEDAYVMFTTRERFASLSHRPVGDPTREALALFTFSVNSREEVDETVQRAIDAGGGAAGQPEDHGFMYDWSFFDPDGHGWGVFWMDPSTVQG